MDFGKFDELFEGFEGHTCVIVDLVVVDHLVHVVGGDWTNDVLPVLVVPHLCVLLQSALVQLVEQREGSWLVVLLLLFCSLLILSFADEEDLLLLALSFLFALGLGLDVEVIGIVEILTEVFRLLCVLGEESLDLDDGGEELEVLARHWLEACQQFRVPD